MIKGKAQFFPILYPIFYPTNFSKILIPDYHIHMYEKFSHQDHHRSDITNFIRQLTFKHRLFLINTKGSLQATKQQHKYVSIPPKFIHPLSNLHPSYIKHIIHTTRHGNTASRGYKRPTVRYHGDTMLAIDSCSVCDAYLLYVSECG